MINSQKLQNIFKIPFFLKIASIDIWRNFQIITFIPF